MTKRMYLISNDVKVGYLSVDDIVYILGFRIAAYDIKKIEFKNAFKIINFDDQNF